MPLYEYECGACGARFEQIQKFSDPPIEVCPNCGERKVQKLLSSPAIQFKGSGWYITDYARKGGKETDAGPKESKESKESGESKESKKESKESGESKESKESRESKSPSKSTDAASAPTTSSKDS
jgi:putative FmdB family regulatory protein